MRRVLGMMRRMLGIFGWLGLSLSALLFIATVVLWVRSLGHEEHWSCEGFEPRPDWKAPEVAGDGIHRLWTATAIHGRLWLASAAWAPMPECEPKTGYVRKPMSGDRAEQYFDSTFQPGERPWGRGTQRAWRFAGAGLCHWRDGVDPWIGRPSREGFRLAVPFWMLAILFGLWPAGFVLRRLLTKKRFAAGLCPTCGYDLRATPDRCPECGTSVITRTP